jgi:hypothetical protein
LLPVEGLSLGARTSSIPRGLEVFWIQSLAAGARAGLVDGKHGKYLLGVIQRGKLSSFFQARGRSRLFGTIKESPANRAVITPRYFAFGITYI